MKIYRLYESLLNEGEIASCIKNFGHELFGDQFGGTERNTPTENDYIDQIKDFTDNMYGEETTKEFITMLDKLKSCMSQYPEILIPESTTAYRGTMIPISYFIKNKQLIDLEKGNKYIYKANSQVQSWSISYENAANFGSYESFYEIVTKIDYGQTTKEGLMQLLKDVTKEDLRLPFILAYNTNPNEYIFKSEYFSKLSRMSHENEFIRFTNKPISVTAYMNDENTDYLTNRGLNVLAAINKAISIL